MQKTRFTSAIPLATEWEGNCMFDRENILYWLGGNCYGTSHYDSTWSDDAYGMRHDFLEVMGHFNTASEAVEYFHDAFGLEGYIC